MTRQWPSRRRSLIITAALAGTVSSHPCLAGQATVVTQSAETSRDGKVQRSNHAWTLDDDGRFTLTVTSGSAETRYVFNGRTFYVCARLTEADVQAWAKTTLASKSALDRLRLGACEVVPSNFLVRFFLSPITAVQSVDGTDGLRLTLALTDHKITRRPGSGEAVAGQTCQNGQRRYLLTKSDATGKGAQRQVARLDEGFCQAAHLPWRRGLWNEVAKTVLRQPKGAALLAALRSDAADLAGLPLTAETRQDTHSDSGPVAHLAYRLKTMSIKRLETPDQAYRIPEGFTIFSPEETLAKAAGAAATATAAANGPKPTPNSTPAATPLLDQVEALPAAFFCALAGSVAGPLACIQAFEGAPKG